MRSKFNTHQGGKIVISPSEAGYEMSETGYISHIRKFAIHDGPGIRTTAFLMGCPLRCAWCHNPECRVAPDDLEALAGHAMSRDQLCVKLTQDIPFYEQSGGGVTISGGEPLSQSVFVKGALERCREAGIHTAVDTCGEVPWARFEEVMELVDLWLYDLKVIDNVGHRKFTGSGNETILANLIKLADTDAEVRIRVPLIPGITDTNANLKALAAFVQGLDGLRHIDLLPYNPLGAGRAQLKGAQVQTAAELAAMREVVASSGAAVYIGGGA
ncbi:radical SAM protein [Candidatus Neomarinimicrobiota bacterium]